MTDYELMWKLYPEWYQENPYIPLVKIFLVLALLLIVPYLYVHFIEQRIIALLKKFPPLQWHELFII